MGRPAKSHRMADRSAFSELLREQRRTAGYSQEELADRAGISLGAIGALEQGLRRAPHRDTVKALADALGMSDVARNQFEEAAARARGRQRRNVSAIPPSLTSFVERNEVSELKGLVADHRLVTITGSPGIGKTRIAIEVARRIEDSYDGTWFVDLLPIRDQDPVASHIALCLNVSVEGDDGLSGVIHHLRKRHSLLVIDNCEHVIADAVAVVEKVLRHCPLLTVLATSREELAHSAELVYRLPPMDSQTASDLFLARVHQADGTWSADAECLAAVADICKVLDGIPLAIELAASRVASLGLEALRSRLEGGVTLTGSRDLPLRHQTMTAMIAWSYDLLSDTEAQLFRRLSVLAGGFTLELAENVGQSQSLPVHSIADMLSRLVQKSLLNVTHLGTSTRYGFLESIRTFALQRLTEAGELEDTMLRLIECLKQRAAANELSPGPADAVESHVDLDNAVVAIRWAESTGRYAEIVSAAEIMIGFARAWYGHRRHNEARALGLSLLERLDDRESPEIVGRLSHRLIGTIAAAELIALAPRAIELLKGTGYPERAADFHARCAEIEWSRGNTAAAEDHLARAASLLDTPELRRTRSGVVTVEMSAYVRCLLRDFSGARACLEQIDPPAGDVHEIVKQLVLAEIEFYEGHIEKAIEISRRSVSRLSSYSHAHHERLQVFGNLGRFLFLVGDTRGSEEALRESAGILVTLSSPNYLYFAISYGRFVAALAAQGGRADFSARLLAACDAADQRGGHHSVQNEVARNAAIRAIDEQLSPERAKALRAQGADEDVFALLEEFIAQPAASESARLSATSSP